MTPSRTLGLVSRSHSGSLTKHTASPYSSSFIEASTARYVPDLLSSSSFLLPSMSPHALCQVHPVVKSESPPILSVSISSIQSHPPYPDSAFRFGTGEHNALPPFSFMSQPRSSTWPQHTTISHLSPYSTSAPGSQSHFGLPPMDDATALTLTDECDDGDELGDLPSASGSAADMFPDSLGSSSKAYDKAVRRRSSKGAS